MCCDARSALQGDLYGTPLLYEILFKYRANNLSKQVSQTDYNHVGEEVNCVGENVWTSCPMKM